MSIYKIKEEALKLFSQKGYEASSIRDIAYLVGLKAPSIYNHFSSKEELFLEVLSGCIEELMGGVRNIVKDSETEYLPNLLYKTYRYFIYKLIERNPSTVFFLRYTMFPPEELREKIIYMFAEKTRDVEDSMAYIFAKCIEERIIKDREVTTYLRAFYKLATSHLYGVMALGTVITEEILESEWNGFWNYNKA